MLGFSAVVRLRRCVIDTADVGGFGLTVELFISVGRAQSRRPLSVAAPAGRGLIRARVAGPRRALVPGGLNGEQKLGVVHRCSRCEPRRRRPEPRGEGPKGWRWRVMMGSFRVGRPVRRRPRDEWPRAVRSYRTTPDRGRQSAAPPRARHHGRPDSPHIRADGSPCRGALAWVLAAELDLDVLVHDRRARIATGVSDFGAQKLVERIEVGHTCSPSSASA